MNFKLYLEGPVIMVDDNELDYYAASRMAKKSKLANPWLYCASGEDFLVYLDMVKLGKKEMPALVLMDINMPGLNGHETIAIVRQDASFKDLPIIAMLTSSVDILDREKANNAGANDYLEKPATPEDYIKLFNSFVDSH